MNTQDQLRENFEDALFAMLMGQLAEEEGKRLLEENERLKNDPDAAVPEQVNQKCLKTIRQSFAKQNRKIAAKTTRSILHKLLVAAMISVFLFVTAYASFPEFRLKALNLLIEISNVATSLVATDQGTDYNADASVSNRRLAGYALPALPDEFVVDYKGHDRTSERIQYTNKQGATIYFRISSAGNTGVNSDTENAKKSERLEINKKEALYVEKDGRTSLSWYDTEQNKFIQISAVGIDRASLISYAEKIKFIETH